ncbi:hypothetical protein CB1_001131002 [Camelus ferus]|nr:hypothetical protein CB1_001131002 [Camelus ferus]
MTDQRSRNKGAFRTASSRRKEVEGSAREISGDTEETLQDKASPHCTPWTQRVDISQETDYCSIQPGDDIWFGTLKSCSREKKRKQD